MSNEITFVEPARDENKKRLDELFKGKNEIISKYIDGQDEDGNTGLHMCVGNTYMLQFLKNEADCNIVNSYGETPLHIAIKMDLVDSVLLLIFHGADVRIQTRKQDADNPKTAYVDLAQNPAETAKDIDANSCLQALLFCGADYPDLEFDKDRQAEQLNDAQLKEIEESDKNARIVQGYLNKKIVYSGMNIGRSGQENKTTAKEHRMERLGLQISPSLIKGDLLFLCRRIDSSYQASCASYIPVIESVTGETLLSNIFQFRVDRDAPCKKIAVKLFVPFDQELKTYRDIVLIQVVEEKAGSGKENRKVIQSTNVVGEWACFENARLYYNPTGGFTTMGVYSKNKTDTIKVDPGVGADQTFQSTVEPKFKVTLSPASQEGVEEVEIEVTKVDTNVQPDIKASNFCSIMSKGQSKGKPQSARSAQSRSTSATSSEASSQSQANGDSIDLPLPALPEASSNNKSMVIGCPSEEAPEDGGSWDIVQATKTENPKDGTVNVKGTGVGFGKYIVLVVEKVAKFGYNMKILIREMYMKASGTTVQCILFAAVKKVDQYKFLVLVTLCEQTAHKNEEQELKNERFQLDRCSKTFMNMNTKLTYYIKLDVNDGTPFPNEILPIQYQANNPKQHKFSVKPVDDKNTPDGYMAIHEKLPSKKPKAKRIDVAAKSFPITFEKSPDFRKLFPSDELITKLGAKMGKDYFAIGIYLGNKGEYLQLLDDVHATSRAEQILYRWRTTYYTDDKGSSVGDGLSILMVALREAGRIDIREELVKAIQSENDGQETRWLSSYEIENGPHDFKSLKLSEVSPFSDVFLYKVATKIICADGVLLDLNAGNDQILADQKTNLSPQRKSFDVVLRARQMDEASPPVKSLKTLIESMRRHGLNLTLETLGNYVSPWLSSMLQSADDTLPYSKKTLDEVKKIFQLK